jgi:hypothetical protein
MTRYPRAFKFRRVPAIPPKTISRPAVVHTFQFTLDVRRFATPAPWHAFLDFLDIARKDIPVSALHTHSNEIKQCAEKKGFKFSWQKVTHSYLLDDEEVTITLEEKDLKQPRISSKLAATFTWKLRKYLNRAS